MSSHFSANQYETAFSPQRLQNYQIPAKYKERPSLRKGHTTIISNDRGHLNADISRLAASPWGSFLGTWQMQRKPIQLKSRTKLLAHLAVTDDASRHESRASRPGTGVQSIQGSVQSPAGSRVSSAEGSRLQSPVGSRIGSSESQRVQSALARSITSPPSSAGSTRPRTASTEPHSRASEIQTSPQLQSRPESRMGVGESGVQSPLGPRPPSSQVPLTSSSREPTAGTSAGLQETRASVGGHVPHEDQPVNVTLARTETPLTTAT